MVEIAISLAVIGIALVAILGVLPIGLRMQRENRELTLINQDATVLMEHIRNGARNQYEVDLTNYIYAITNAWTLYNLDGTVLQSGLDGYDFTGSQATRFIPTITTFGLTNNLRIIGLLSIPEYTDKNDNPLPGIITNIMCFSNHIVAYVHSISGAAVDRPPQDNPLLRQSSFGYRVVCQNLPTPMPLPAEWKASLAPYNRGDKVYTISGSKIFYWQSLVGTNNDQPPQASWQRDGYTETLVSNSRELRLTFLWPQLPNGNVGTGHWTYRASIAGNLAIVTDTNCIPPGQYNVHCFQSQSFTTNAP